MRSLCFVVIVSAVLAACPGLCSAAPYMLSDFESDADFAAWEATGQISNCPDACTPWPATVARLAGHATEGSYSCQIDLNPADYQGCKRYAFTTNDWSAYNTLFFDVENPTTGALTLHIEISDTIHGESWVSRYITDMALIPGVNHIKMGLVNLPLNETPGYLDTSTILAFSLSVWGQTEPTTVYFDNMRLDNIQDDPDADAARGIWKFDVGDGGSRWTDFFSLAAGTTYPLSPEHPFGWTDSNYRYSGDFGGPDDLVRDFVRPLPCCPDDDAASMTFRLDVPNGTYHVYVIARSGNLSEMPVMGYRIEAEGVTAVDVPMDSTIFYSTDYFYRGMNEDYPFSAPAWDMFEQTNFPAYSFTATVSDGHLDLRFVHAWVYAIIVYPDDPDIVAEMTTRIADLTTARRTQFESSYYINNPEQLTFTPTPEETARGYAAWPASLMDACYPDTLPPSPRPALSLSTFAAQGEYRPVSLAIRPLADIGGVSLEVTDLDDGLGHTIPSAEIERQYLRYMATGDTEFFGAGVLSWKPRLLQTSFPISVGAQVAKQLWLTIHVPNGLPNGTYTGTVTLHASSGDLMLPISVEVYAFALDRADDEAYGWYYNPPESQYSIDTRFFPDLVGRADELLRLDLSLMKEHGFNSLQFPTAGISVDSSGHVTSLDTSALERYLTAMREVGFGGGWIGQMGTLSLADQIMSAGHAEFSPLFDQAFKEALAALVTWGETPAGAPLAFYLVDEPQESGIQPWNRNFADSMQYCDLANQVPGATSTITVMSDSGGGVDYTPFADALDIMQTHPWPNSEGVILGAFSQGKPNWFYNTGGDLRMVYGFYQYKYGGGGGAWEWHYDWLDGDMFDTFPYSPFNNHWRYVYPSPDGPVPTLNFELASLGITDYRYVSTLGRMSAQARASGLPDFIVWADDADALLQAIQDETPAFAIDNAYRPIHFAGIAEGPGCLAQVEAALEDYRRQIAEMIMALPGPLPGVHAEVVSTSLPSAMQWDEMSDASITIRNLDTVTWTVAGGYQLRSTGDLDRWGLLSVPLAGDVPPDTTTVFDFTVSAPPLTTISYTVPITPTAAGLTDDIACSWSMSHSSEPISGGTASEDVVVSRFPDIQPATAGAWARFWVEECAGRVPMIVVGYPDGTYRPGVEVDRAAMAVYTARALKLAFQPYEGLFPADVPESQWAWPWIEALARAGLVQGYDDGTYRPSAIVNRDAMAVYVARGICGGVEVPPGPPDPTFSDVPTSHWAYDEIELTVAHNVVQGYPDGTYRPDSPVSRDQMAVFIYKGFIMPTGAPVVLGGPAITAVDLETAGYWGWSSLASAPAADPGFAYVVLDAVRLGTNLLGPDSFFDVFFELQGPETVSHTVSLSESDLAAARGEAMASGVPYYAVSWDIPAGLAPGSYTLVVSLEDETDTTYQLARQPAFTILP
jgi:hypothetical protein